MEGAFRRIDIDAYDEDQVLPTDLYDPYPLEPAQAAAQAQSTDKEARGLLSRGDPKAALRQALAHAPYGDESYAQAKSLALATVLYILLQTSQADMTAIVKDLAPEEQDQLMKYIYKGMENPSEGSQANSQCAALLSWHSKLLETAGTGCIIRVMTDHKRV